MCLLSERTTREVGILLPLGKHRVYTEKSATEKGPQSSRHVVVDIFPSKRVSIHDAHRISNSTKTEWMTQTVSRAPATAKSLDLGPGTSPGRQYLSFHWFRSVRLVLQISVKHLLFPRKILWLSANSGARVDNL